MLLMRTSGLAFIAILATALPAAAEGIGRYALVPAGEAFLRLDTENGAVSLCSRKSAGWACEHLSADAVEEQGVSVGTDRLDKEIGGLRDRLAKTESDLAAAIAANAGLAARTEAAEKAARDARAEAAEAASRVAKAEEAAKEAEAEPQPVEPHAFGPAAPGQAVDELSQFLGKLMRRLQELAKNFQAEQSERAL